MVELPGEKEFTGDPDQACKSFCDVPNERVFKIRTAPQSQPVRLQRTSNPQQETNSAERQHQPGVDYPDVPDVYTTVLRANKNSKKLLLQGDIAYKIGRNALNCTDCLWPKSNSGIVNVPYVLSPDYDVNEVSIITAAMEEFKTLTCVKFIPQTVETDYLDIKQDSGCWSIIGMTHGAQTVSLRKDECISHRTVQHELNHALGFVHEQCRSDRDDYVTIMTQYISPGDISNFDKQDTNNLGVQYDYSSLMHYPRYAFSNTSGQDTIVPKPDPNVPIGQSYGLSNLDVLKINRLYECDICSSLISSHTGTVTSENYPSAYLNNTNCLWLIRIPANKVFLTFEAVDIQPSTNCMSDYVKVYDGASKTSPVLLDKTCGSGMLPSFISSSNSMLLEFVSDGAATATGFKASYTEVYCGAIINSAPGVITSPGYPNLYPPSVDCFWIITAPPQKTVLIYFNVFNLETYTYCRYDYVRIYDGKTTSSPLIGTFCSKRSFNIASSGTSMLIKFHSDNTNQYTGFQASYTFCKSIKLPSLLSLSEVWVKLSDLGSCDLQDPGG
ncbi:embryonic protein UVS.2-like [Bombina bombina]|uniref:embryonic protein UVS.2-like n=1 Tax=Bombina bombina TaxID=8345 RepID=UPI00235AB056|nr:embryonic protein UVS.2-like [Bombina bombina]